MCSINHDKKCIFIHIPKTGGSYISSILDKHYGFKSYYLRRPDHKKFCMGMDKSVDKHENKIHGTLMYYRTSRLINHIMGMNQTKWDTYFIFTFVRNPYDRIVSGWNYCNKYKIPFDKYINIDMATNSFDYWHVFMPQVRHIIGPNGIVKEGLFIGKFENIEKDLKTALWKIGINEIIHKPFKKNSKKHDDYRDYYNVDDLIQKVNKICSEDFDYFDYPLFRQKSGACT